MQDNEFPVNVVAVLGGGGDLGGGLAYRLVRAGYEVVIGSRDAERARSAVEALRQRCANMGQSDVKCHGTDNVDAAARGDMVVLAVPYASQRETLDAVATVVAGKIVVCATVPLMPPKVARVQLPAGGSAGKEAQDQLGEGVHVVSAFQNVAAAHLREDGPVDCDVLVTGNSVAARSAVINVAGRCGIVGHHAGPIDNAAAAEALTSVLIGLNKRYKTHTGIRVTGLSSAN
ncbi:NADPH-dependent F420 reductase [Nitratireductor sp. CAU 1489]|uniref:NADPH-dependent F420 reductase n=1 Tax=Nitratireductor arenosus TaxID=2682096 RepID=A0A844Q7Z9_9HYPH|nr:NADPH-dependent F420 reductase [Nitratireductor arenosus]MVA96226.1 NADPH-dependent F420 reductase [Nitratireductor arenosus]